MSQPFTERSQVARTSQNSTHIQEEVPSTSSSQNNTSIQEEVPSSSGTKETRSSKKRKCESPTAFELQLLDCVKNNTADNMDEDLNFLKSLLPSVTKLSGYKKLLFRTKVLEALIDIQKEMVITIEDLSETQNTVTDDLQSLNIRSDTNSVDTNNQ